ncbi:S-layer homology domain-containing protein [Paenibacillus riograndensis]|nr:S-layer homology domain-containing protein [Paenibacillus riograndensis]
MYSKRLRSAVSMVLVFILSFMGVLEVSAASLKATVITSEKMLNGTQKISVNSVLDVTYGDYNKLNEVKFSLSKDGNVLATQIKQKDQGERLSAADSVYSLKYPDISFEGLTAGEEVVLQAEYQGESGIVVTDPQSIKVPASSEIQIVVERMTKDSDTYVNSSTGEVRSDDKNIRLTILSKGVPLANEAISVGTYSSYNNLTTDEAGQVQIIGNPRVSLTSPVLFVSVRQGKPDYEATPLYVNNLMKEGTYTAAIRYLDGNGKLIQQQSDNISLPSGVSQSFGTSGLDVLVLKTGEISDSYPALIRSVENEVYMFQTSQTALYSAADGAHLEIVQDSSEYSRLGFEYSWEGAPVEIESFSIVPNNQYKQVNLSNPFKNITSNSLYVKKNVEYDITAVAGIPGTNSKVVLRNQVKPAEDQFTVQYAAKAADFSALKVQVPDRGQGLGDLFISYLNNKFNYNELSLKVQAADSTLYVRKGEEIHRLTTTVSGAAKNSSYNDEIVLNSFFTPADNEYAFKGGSKYTSQVILKALSSDYYDQDEVRNQIVLGENLQLRVDMKDEYNNAIDLTSDYTIQILDASGAIVEDNGLSWTSEEEDGKLMRISQRQWKPAKSGDYTIQFLPHHYVSGTGYVKGAVIAETALKVLPKQELEVEIRDKSGNLVDLVNKPYMNIDQAEKVTITVREHITGGLGKVLPGVKVTRYGEDIGVTDEQGQLVLPARLGTYLGEFFFKKTDYLSRTESVAVIDPKNQAVVRVRGLDKAEGAYDGGVPLDYAYVQAVIKKSDDSYTRQSKFIGTGGEQTFLVVESPSTVGVDFMRYNRSYLGVESKYGYYMYGSIHTEPGKDYSLLLDAREPLQAVSKVNLTKYMEELSVIRKDLPGVDYVPYVIDSNTSEDNYFYATEGTYSVLAHTKGDIFIYRDDVAVNAGDNIWDYNDSAAGLATLLAPDSGSIYGVEYITPARSQMRGYSYDARQIQLTPGEVIVKVDQLVGSLEYQFNIHFAAGALKAGTISELVPGAIAGLDIFGLQNGKLVRTSGNEQLQFGLVDTAGNQIGQLSKPRILVTDYGSSRGYKLLYPEAASYEIQDEAGMKLYEGTSTGYPINVNRIFPNGTYVLKASVTIEGKTYSLDKKFVLDTAAGTVIDPGVPVPGGNGGSGGTDPGNGSNPDNGSGNGSGNGNGNGNGNSSGNGNGGVTAPVTTTPVNVNVNEQNTKLQDLVKNTNGTQAERAAAAQKALGSIAESLKSGATAQEAEQNSKSMSQALDSAAQLLASIQDPAEKQKIVGSIHTLIDSAPYILNKLDTADKALAFAQTLIQNAAAVLNNTQGVAAAEIEQLKQSIVSSSQAALNKAGEVTISKEHVTLEGNTVSSQLTEELVSKQIEASKKALAAVSEQLTAKLGAGLASELKVSLTVEVPAMGDGVNKLNTSLPSEILKVLQDNKVDGLKLQMGTTAFTIEPDTFGTVEAGQKITLAAEVVENAVIGKPGQAEPLATLPVMEFRATVGDKAVKHFEKPVNVTFDVSAINTSKYPAENLERLTVYVLNETSLTWEAVGGKYDPITQTVSALRGHFSRYTVMIGSASFKDVADNHWAKKEINYLLTKGILEQTAEFNPSGKVTRAQFANWISRAYGLDGSGLTLPFSDVAAGSAGYNGVAAAYEAGIITGKSSTVFDPEATISRQEIATMLARALTLYNGAKTVADPGAVNAAYADGGKIAKWAAAGVALANRTDLFKGFEDGTFRPAQTATKAEAAALIYRLYQLK